MFSSPPSLASILLSISLRLLLSSWEFSADEGATYSPHSHT